jgi:uncharacterized membrane protein YbhN (UPF0104 family)
MTTGPTGESAEDAALDVDAVEEGGSRTRSPLRRLFGDVLLPLVFAVLLLAFVWNEHDRLDPLADAQIGKLVALVALMGLVHFLNSSEFWLLYRANGVHSGIFENWFVFLASQLGNNLPGQAGSIYRLRYMRAVHGASYATSAAVYAADFVATLAGAAAVALIGVIGQAATGGKMSWVMLFVSLGVALLAVVFAVVPTPSFASRAGRLARVWRSFHAGFEQSRREPLTIFAVMLIEMAKYVAYAIRLAIAFDLLGIKQPFWLYLVLAPAGGVAAFIAITPGAFGFREGFVAAAAAAMGAGLDSGLLAATADRAVQLATAIGLGTVGFLITYPRLRAVRRAEGRPAPVASS